MEKWRTIFFISLKNLISDKIRFAITVAGVSLAVCLILLLKGISLGAITQATRFIDNSTADIFVVQDGVKNIYQNISILPMGIREVLQEINGVKMVGGIVSAGAAFESASGRQGHLYFFGLEPDSLAGRSWEIVKGRRWQEATEIVIDRVMAKKYQIDIGEKLKIRDSELTVVGFTTGGTFAFGCFSFTTEDDAWKIMRLSDIGSYFQVYLEPGVNSEAIIGEIQKRIPDVAVYSNPQFRKNHRQVVEETIIPPIQVMVAISFFVGMAVIGLTLYTSAVERKKEYGILRAIGARNRNLYQIVLCQALLSAFAGFWLGFLGSLLIKTLVAFFIPEVEILITNSLLFSIFLLANLMSVVAVVIPVKVVGRIDPAVVFKE